MCFNSRTPCGVRHSLRLGSARVTRFNSRTPCGVRHEHRTSVLKTDSFNSRTPCGARLCYLAGYAGEVGVSIHAPRVGCDGAFARFRSCVVRFNSRTPCGVRPSSHVSSSQRLSFQFTHPVWGATVIEELLCRGADVSIHAPRVGRDYEGVYTGGAVAVSIHAPRVGRDGEVAFFGLYPKVSIHAPRVGCDYLSISVVIPMCCFNSRTPCGVRLPKYLGGDSYVLFQFTHPVWGATSLQTLLSSPDPPFQFTHPVWGATKGVRRLACIARRFNSRTPCGARPGTARRSRSLGGFNSRTPCGARR